MKPQNIKKILITIISLVAFYFANAQNTFPSIGPVGIGTTSVNASSLLEVNSTTKGVLLSRMTKSQRDAISSPATGLLIYQTNSTPGFYYNTSTTSTASWTALKVSDHWKIGGNSFSGTHDYKYLGTNNDFSLGFKINGNLVLALVTPFVTGTGLNEVRFVDGGLIGTGTKYSFTTYEPPSSSLLISQAARVHLAEPDTTNTIKGFVFRASGTNTTASFSAINTSIGPSSFSAMLAYSVPQSGYGTGIYAVGGGTGVSGKGSGGGFSGTVYGISGYAVGMPGIGTRVGVYGKADTAALGYGIYGAAGVICAVTRAGYFSGDLQYTGLLIGPSDIQLKENIQPYTGALDKLKMIKVKTYNFKPEYSFMHLARGQQIGLISQDLEKIFPELVIESVHPADYNQETREKISDEIHYKGLNYVGLVPILIEGMNEQQMQIEELKKLKYDMIQLRNENSELKNQIAEINRTLNALNSKNIVGQETSKAMLEQNIPNPFSENTLIRYFIPPGSDRATLNIYSSDKILIKSFPVNAIGNGELTITPELLSAGNYLYELVIDSKVIASKKMILTK